LAGKGSRKNKVAILADEAPGRQDVKMQEYLDMPSFLFAAGRDDRRPKCDVIFE